MSDDEDFDDDYSEKLTDIQLGFVQKDINKLFLEKDCSKWDGGRIGGVPIWLDISKIPTAESLKCEYCGAPCIFLLQIYCPLDDYEPTAYHRCLYVFCCRKATCNAKGSMQCLRSQLPKVNAYYKTSSSESEAPDSLQDQDHALQLCGVCGLEGSFCCSACASSPRPVRYCSKNHQQVDWKYHKQICGKNIADIDVVEGALQRQKRVITFAEYEICIEEENLDIDSKEKHGSTNDDSRDVEAALKSAKINPSTVIWEDAVTEGGEDEKADADLKQGDYDKALGNEESDPVYSKFLSRVRHGGDKQVLRYYCGPRTQEEQDEEAETSVEKPCEDHMPLAVSATGYVDPDLIPPCEYCHAPRVFEFQIMPQLLHFLKVDERTHINKLKCLPENDEGSLSSTPSDKDVFFNQANEDLDWGTIDIFTCSQSCTPPSDSPYVSEYCWRQPPPVVTGHQLHRPSVDS